MDLNESRFYLDAASERIAANNLQSSVLSVVRAYNPRDKSDLEIWALFCALLDYQIPVQTWAIPLLSGIVNKMSKTSIKFTDYVHNFDLLDQHFESLNWGANNQKFSHRLVKISYIKELFLAVRSILLDYSSLGNYVRYLFQEAMHTNNDYPLEFAIKHLALALRKHASPEFKKQGFVPDPEKKATFKTLCLYFRWMVRPYPDLETWQFIHPRFLLPSIDSSITLVMDRVFGLKLKSNPDWSDVLAVASPYRNLNPDDPLKYDFLFSRPAIMGFCKEDSTKNQCYLCPLIEICTSCTPLPATDALSAMSSPQEREIFDRFLVWQGSLFDKVMPEFPLGNRRADAVIHLKTGLWWVIEVEPTLNYPSIGQAIVYRNLCKQIRMKKADAIIVCAQADPQLKSICEMDAGIHVISLD